MINSNLIFFRNGKLFHQLLISMFLSIFSFCLSTQTSTASTHQPSIINRQFPINPLLFPWAGGLNSCQFCAIDLNLDGINDLLLFDRHGNRKLTFINNATPNTIDYRFAQEYARNLPDLHDWVITCDYNCDGKADIFTYGLGGVRVFKNVSDTILKFSLVTDLLESFYYTGKVGILVTSVDYPAVADIDGDGDLDLLTFFGMGSYVEYHKNLSMEKYGHCDSLDFRLTDHCWGKFKESEGGNRVTLNAPCLSDELQMTSDKIQVTSDKIQVTSDKLQMTNEEIINRHSSFVTCNSSFVIRHSSLVTRHSSLVTRHSSLVTRHFRHRGSTLLATDLNGDGLQDLIVGDVDYPGLVALTNGGTIDTAYMTAQDTVFPAGTKAVHLFSFPAVSLIDLNNDGLNDIVVSPFDQNFFTADNYNCVWFYKNTGSASHPRFEYQTDRLFRNEMMDFGSAAHPVLFDFDGDGLQDLFVGNDGLYDSSYYKDAVLHSVYTSKIAFFKNSGTSSAPVFTYVTDDLAGISSLHLRGAFPAFGDLNGDGLPDLLIGNADGTLIFFPNSGSSAVLPEFGTPVTNYQGINVGDYSTPQLFDLNKDGKPDLIVGEQNGNLNYYANSGPTSNPEFNLITDSLGKINVTNYNLSYNGFSTPCFARHPDGTTFLVIGSDEGRIHLFNNIDHNTDGKFTESGGLYEWLSSTPKDTLFGWQTSPAIGHLTDTEAFDIITGNFAGGLNYITKRTTATIVPGITAHHEQTNPKLSISPNPADQTVTIEYPGYQIPETVLPLHFTPASRIIISDLFGRKILEFPFTGKITLATSALPNGIYIIHCGTFTAKLVIGHP